MLMNKRSGFVFVLILLLLMLSSCRAAEMPAPSTPVTPSSMPPTASMQGEQTAIPTQPGLPTPTPYLGPVGPDQYPIDVNPLTGQVVADVQILDRRPVMLKIANFPLSSRPQSGLSFADLVFEYYIGAGATRFTTVHYGLNSVKAGPIRSGRLPDIQLASLYGGILGFKGYGGGAVKDRMQLFLPGRALSDAGDCCNHIYPSDPSDINSVVVDTALFSEYVENIGMENDRPSLEGMAFDSRIPDGGIPGQRAWVYYNRHNQVAWEFDPNSGMYLRDQDMQDGSLKPITDALTERQISASNVVILLSFHTVHTDLIIDLDLWKAKQGKAYIFRDGRMYEATYAGEATDRPLRFYDLEGNPLFFKPGSTWFQIVGITSRIEDLGGGALKYTFNMP